MQGSRLKARAGGLRLVTEAWQASGSDLVSVVDTAKRKISRSDWLPTRCRRPKILCADPFNS